MTPLAASGRLQNVFKYWLTVRKTDPVGNESNNSAKVGRTITTNDIQNVCRDFWVDWRSVLLGHWWDSCWRFTWDCFTVDCISSKMSCISTSLTRASTVPLREAANADAWLASGWAWLGKFLSSTTSCCLRRHGAGDAGAMVFVEDFSHCKFLSPVIEWSCESELCNNGILFQGTIFRPPML